MPNFARILVNILLYVLYVVVIAFLGGFVFPLIYLSLGKEIPVYTSEVYNLVFFIVAGFVFLLTLIFRKSCYLGLQNDDESSRSQMKSYTQKKKQKKVVGKHKDKTENKTIENNTENEKIKIYVEKEIQ